MPRVGSGTYTTATITTSKSADAKAKSAAIAATAGTFVALDTHALRGILQGPHERWQNCHGTGALWPSR